MLDDVVGDDARGPFFIHPVLQVGIVDNCWSLRESQSLATQLELFLALATQTLCVSIG